MHRRTFLSALLPALIATPVIAALAACGDPDRSPAEAEPTTPATTPGTATSDTATPATAIAHPTGADDVVVKLSYEGGFVPAGFAFVNTPSLLVSGDGRLFTPAVVPAIYPGPLLPSMFVRTITEEGMQSLLGIVQSAGLLAPPPVYEDRNNVADAPNTVLTVSGGPDGTSNTFVHSAYALGIGDPQETGARKTLLDVTTTLADVDKAAGAANLGADEAWAPAAYRFQARVVDPTELTGQDPAPSIVEWPATAGVSLADASTCARVDAATIGSLFTDAKQNTYFQEGEVTYQVSVAGVLPGDLAC